MRSVLRVALGIVILGPVACGGDEKDGSPKVRTTKFGTVILNATDEKDGRPGTREFDEVNDQPFATIKLR